MHTAKCEGNTQNTFLNISKTFRWPLMVCVGSCTTGLHWDCPNADHSQRIKILELCWIFYE